MNAREAASANACANPGCTKTVERRPRGRQRRFCSRSCQERALRGRVLRPPRVAQGVTAESPSKPNFNAKLASDTNSLDRSVVGNNSYPSKSLSWVKVNDCTWKLTDGENSITPACHGFWGGYYTEKAVAWVIEVGWPFGKSAWYARCGAESFGPTNFKTAKEAARAFLTGALMPNDERASAFIGPVDLHADPDVAAELPRRT
jgi:hypothetical protein